MAVPVRLPSGLPDNLVWPVESAIERDRRREALCALDGVVLQLEEQIEMGLAQQPALPRLFRQVQAAAHGILAVQEGASALELFEETMRVEELYTRPTHHVYRSRPRAPRAERPTLQSVLGP